MKPATIKDSKKMVKRLLAKDKNPHPTHGIFTAVSTDTGGMFHTVMKTAEMPKVMTDYANFMMAKGYEKPMLGLTFDKEKVKEMEVRLEKEGKEGGMNGNIRDSRTQQR